jgi:hypothetical protein
LTAFAAQEENAAGDSRANHDQKSNHNAGNTAATQAAIVFLRGSRTLGGCIVDGTGNL